FLEVCLVMHIPSEDDGTEPEALLSYREELLLGDELPTKHAIGIKAGHLNLGVIGEDLFKAIEGYRVSSHFVSFS
ncbi:hypothetical protein FQN49_006569, partial [Arthroderma sp. PD_2]